MPRAPAHARALNSFHRLSEEVNVGKLAVLLAVVIAVAGPLTINAAPGNPLSELKREEVKFRGMYSQLDTWNCNLGEQNSEDPNYVDLDGMLDALNRRREAAYRRRGQSTPESFSFTCDEDEDEG